MCAHRALGEQRQETAGDAPPPRPEENIHRAVMAKTQLRLRVRLGVHTALKLALLLTQSSVWQEKTHGRMLLMRVPGCWRSHSRGYSGKHSAIAMAVLCSEHCR